MWVRGSKPLTYVYASRWCRPIVLCEFHVRSEEKFNENSGDEFYRVILLSRARAELKISCVDFSFFFPLFPPLPPLFSCFEISVS